MGTGFITVKTTTGDGVLPVRAHIVIKNPDGRAQFESDTDQNGNTPFLPFPAPDVAYTLDPNFNRPAYSTCDIDVSADGFVTEHIRGVEIVDTQISILPVAMQPLVQSPGAITDDFIDIPPVALLSTQSRYQANPEDLRAAPAATSLGPVVIPDFITVHLGTPANTAARNVRVRFTDYIKNVASSEIYSTWPQSSLEANIHAIVTFALNRVFTEWYRSRGFNYDITNSTAYDQAFREGGPVFDSISTIVDRIFNTYAHRQGLRNPFFTSFCNGTTVTCRGLSQWGTVTLANQGKTPLEILRYYYPNDIMLTASQNITSIIASFPGSTLRVGSTGDSVRRMQNFLNRIRVNFPLIPRIVNPNGVFGADTQDAVRAFQRSFNMTVDGLIGRDTWNKITFIYVGVTRLAELDAEGERISIGAAPPNVTLSQGSRGTHVLELQFILNAIAPFYPSLSPVIQDSYFGTEVKNAVIEFQKAFNLPQDGVVGPSTWNKLYAVYRSVHEQAPVPPAEPPPAQNAPPYPGTPLRVGSTGPNVRLMQAYLNTIRIVYTMIPYLVVDGNFGEATRAAVIAFQQEFLLAPDGVIGPLTWAKIVEMYLIVTGNVAVSLAYPGTPLRLGSRGSDVRLIQTFLNDIRVVHPGLPQVAVDGIFGPQTQAAVISFQSRFGLVPDGIVGPLTWNKIVQVRSQV